MIELSAALASIEDFYRRIYWHADESTTMEGNGYTLSYSGIPWMHSINHLWMHQATPLNDQLLKLTTQFFKRFNAEYSLVYTEAERSATSFWLADRLYLERASTPIYGLQGLPRPEFLNRDVRIIRACALHQEELISMLNRTFFMGTEASRTVVREQHFADPTIRHYLAYVDEEAAACATVMLHDGIAGVWNVGTLRQFRKQGIASAILMRGLVEAAADGCSNSVLMASPMGKTLYEEMGYQFIANTRFFGPAE
ncbi:MAG: GNAT family N-acetyltransferase [Anaerolineae bacterium]|nr:GNAT family N-acetyltransferase [Anaerolineae bacterium]